MDKIDKNPNIFQYKIIYSLSFILILWGLKDFIISLLPNFWVSYSTNYFYIQDLIGFMIIILLVSLYLYGINYIIINPLSKIKRIINMVASFFWFIFFIFPLLILALFLLKEILSNVVLSAIVYLAFIIITFIFSNVSEEKSKEREFLQLEKEIENLKIMKTQTGMSAEFIRQYLILEAIVKRMLMLKLKIGAREVESIRLIPSTKALFSKEYLNKKTFKNIEKIQGIRNKIVHGWYMPSKKEINLIKETILKLELITK